MRVLKWDVPVDDGEHVVGGGPVVLVAIQGDFRVVQVWTAEVDDPVAGGRTVQVFGTGNPIEAGWVPIGSAVFGPAVWHVFGKVGSEE